MSSLAQSFGASGIATEATLLSVDAHANNIETAVESVDLKTPALGQATMAASSPVVIASNQSAIPVSGPVTDAQLRATAVPVSGPLTDTELRATAVPVSGPLTDAQMRATAVPVSGPLTDTQLRATAVPVSGPLTDTELRATAVPVSGPLTDTQLRASAVPVSLASVPLPSGAATETTLAAVETKVGSLTETAPGTDTASSGLNGRLQRIAQRISSLIGLVPTALGQATSSNSFAVVPASDYVPKSPVNANASFVQTSLSGTTASGATAPANAVGFIFQAPSTNTDPIRMSVGATATTSAGMYFEPGRDSGYIPLGFGVSLSTCATASGTNEYMVQWVLQV